MNPVAVAQRVDVAVVLVIYISAGEDNGLCAISRPADDPGLELAVDTHVVRCSPVREGVANCDAGHFSEHGLPRCPQTH